jgi:Bacterial Ig-like domain (group 3)/Beta-propeller repeat
MKRAYFACLFQCLATTFLLPQSNPVPLINQSAGVVPPISASEADPEAHAKILDSYGKLPMSFEANHGQADARVKFLSRTGGYSLFLTGDEAVLALSATKSNTHKAKIAGTPQTSHSDIQPKAGAVLRMKLRNANLAAKVSGVDELAGTSNYFIGNDPSKWRTNVPTYGKVKYEGIYSGIDLVYYGNQRQLEYDFIVSPGADPHRIAFDISGAKRIRRDGKGDLVFKVGDDEMRWHKPVAYQEKGGTRQEIAAHYAITDKNRVGFELAKYDVGKPLYIDPLIYSTYLGGSGQDSGDGIAVDSQGNAYVTGHTNSTNFPTMNPLQSANHGGHYGYDAFVTKINAAGSALVYSTYLGGSGDDYGFGIAVDGGGNTYVTGVTNSTDFPTKNPLQPANADAAYGNAFVAKINAAGSALVYSTYLGGSGNGIYGDRGSRIAVDIAGNAYITGYTGSTDFPTANPLQPSYGGAYTDAFVTKINSEGSALVYSTYLGGSNVDEGYGIAVDSAGNAYITGSTFSTDFPTANPLQPANGGTLDAFVAKINPSGSAFAYSTYLGGSDRDYGVGIAVDSSGNAYVTGLTYSINFPVTPGALQTQCKNGNGCANYGDAFVTKLNPTGSALVYSTYLGGSRSEEGQAIVVDSAGNAYVAGETDSTNFPKTVPSCSGSWDAFVTRLNPTGSALVYSTCFGGSGTDIGSDIAVDSASNAYVTGFTKSTNFPTKHPLQAAYGGGGDAFIAKIQMLAVTTTTLSSSPNPSPYGQAVTFTAVVTSALGPPPNGETVSFMKGARVLGTGTLDGGSASFTTSALPVGTDYIKAAYGGDSNFAGSTSKAVSQVVSKATTTTALTSSQNPSNFGQSVTFTASVAPQFTGTVKGTVTFYDGTTALKTVALSGDAAKITTSTLTSGSHTITAMYNGSSSFNGSSASLTQTVN